MRSSLMMLAASCVALGCGTVAGNPKKPKDQPPAGQIRYTLPVIDFDFDDTTLADDAAGLALMAAPAVPGGPRDKAVFNDSARRLLQVVRQINAVTTRMNAILAEEDGGAPGDTLRFSGKGSKRKLAGRIRELAGGAYDYEAVLCQDGKPLRQFLWQADGKAIQLTQDFSASTEDGDQTFALVSRATVSLQDGVARLDLAISGTWDDAAAAGGAGDGGSLVEHSFLDKVGEELRLRSVLDRFDGDAPAEPEGERYVVGRMTKREDASAAERGLKSYDVSFVGWGKSIPRPACEGGAFEENADDLWSPDGSGPEFCVGRRLGGKRFASVEEFAEHVATFEAIGLAKKTDLERVLMPEGLACD
jgi:hypothetical protein